MTSNAPLLCLSFPLSPVIGKVSAADPISKGIYEQACTILRGAKEIQRFHSSKPVEGKGRSSINTYLLCLSRCVDYCIPHTHPPHPPAPGYYEMYLQVVVAVEPSSAMIPQRLSLETLQKSIPIYYKML